MKIINAILTNQLKFINNLHKITNALNNCINFYTYNIEYNFLIKTLRKARLSTLCLPLLLLL